MTASHSDTKHEQTKIANEQPYFSESERDNLLKKQRLAQEASIFLLIAWIVNLISILFMISILWLIPMMMTAKLHAKNPSRGSCLALGICSIIFGGVFGIVAGILLIIAHSKTSDIVRRVAQDKACQPFF